MIINGFSGNWFLIFSISSCTCFIFSASSVPPFGVSGLKYTTTCACSIFSNVLRIPMLSTTSCVSRIPAVSINRKPMPPITNSSSMVSRVVPAISETMARSSFNKAFKSVDFPTFGSPTIATGIPFLITFPTEKESINRFKTNSILFSNS